MSFERLLKPRSIAVFGGGHAQEVIRQSDRLGYDGEIWPDQQGGKKVDEGVAIITMSSNVAFNLTKQRRGLPVAYMLSLGNKLKFDLHDAIRIFARQEQVSALGLYVEAISDPMAFEEAVGLAREVGKPIVAIKAGRSEATQKIVVSHTASLAGSDDLMSALFERLGVARVDSLEELIEALKVLHVLGPLKGGRVGATSTSGGDLILLGDAMIGTGLSMPPLSEEGVERIRSTVHERVVVANPLDYQMFDWDDEERMAEKFSAFLAEDFDVTLCVLDYPREDLCDQSTWGGAERGFVQATHRTGAKTGVLSTFSDNMWESVAERLIKEGIVPLAGIGTGLAGLQAAVDVGAAWSRDPGPPLLRNAGRANDGPGKILEMLLRADFVIVAEHARFMLPEVRIGIAPDVGTFVLPKLLPRQKALEILMTGR